MNLRIKHNSSPAVLLFFICCLSGCATGSGAHRFYSGPPLPRNEIALVYAVTDCHIRDIRNETEKETRHLDFLKEAASSMLDLLPGQYIVGITFSRTSSALETRTQTLGDKVRIRLNAQPGNIYIIYPEIDASNSLPHSQDKQKSQQTWRPIIVNIADYDIKECAKHNKYGGCPSKEVISKRTNVYLQGERPIMSFHPLSETPYYVPATEEAKRDIKGFWW